MVFLVVQIRSGPKVLKPWYGCVINESCTLCDVFTEFSGGRLDGSLPIPAEYSGTAVEAFVGAKRTELTRVSCECTVGEAITALGQYVEYTVSVDMSMNVETSSNKADAMAILMKGTQERSNLPNKWRVDVPNQKLKLKNDIIDWLQTNKLGWEPSYSQQLGAAFVNALANTLWMIDGNHRTLADRGCQVPTMFEHFQGYNKPELRKKRKIDHTNLNGSEIQAHSVSLFTLAGNSYMKRKQWSAVHESVLRLADNLRKYASYLEQQNQTFQKRQAMTTCRSDVDDFDVLPATSVIKPTLAARYRSLHDAIVHAKDFEPILVEDHSPPCPKRRYDYNHGLVVPVKCVQYSYTGSRNHLHFIWKLPAGLTEGEVLKKNVNVSQELRKKLPTYHSRAMRREFINSFGRYTNSKPAFLREAYRRLTGDAAAASTTEEEEVDKRVAKLLEMEDPDLIWDLRIQSDGRPEKYTVFLEECKRYLQASVETAVDERRHDAVDNGEVVTHFARALSVRDMFDQVCERCPEGTPIPSIQWLR